MGIPPQRKSPPSPEDRYGSVVDGQSEIHRRSDASFRLLSSNALSDLLFGEGESVSKRPGFNYAHR